MSLREHEMLRHRHREAAGRRAGDRRERQGEMPVEFGVLLPTREAVMSGRPETAPSWPWPSARRPPASTRCGSATRSPRGRATSRSRCMAAVAARTRRVRLGTARAAAGAAQPGGARPRRRHARSHRRGPRDPRRRHRRRHAGDPPGVRRRRRAVGAPRRALPRDARDLPRAVEPRRRRASAASTSRSTTSPWSPSRTARGGPPIWIGGSGPTALREAARFDAWFPTGPSVEFFAEHFPAHPGRRARGGPAGRRRDRRRLRHARARRRPRPPAEQRLPPSSRRTTRRRPA